MKNLLDQLNDVPGVQGSMVITRDGIMVVEALGPQLQEDAVAALSSSLVNTLQKALETIDKDGSPEEMVLSATEGKLIFSDLGNAFLVVVTRPNLKLGTGLIEIRSISRRLRDLCTMDL